MYTLTREYPYLYNQIKKIKSVSFRSIPNLHNRNVKLQYTKSLL
jgi:hypothetical protein